MMTYEMMMDTIATLGDDAYAYVRTVDGTTLVDVTLCDFEGFGDDWSEEERQFDDEDAVDEFLEMLASESFGVDRDYYTTYHFDGFDVLVGYDSYDI